MIFHGDVSLQVSKSKCTKHTILGPLLEVEMSKKCTPLWREPRFQVKSVKNWWVRTTFWRSDVFCMASARDCALCQKRAKRESIVALSTTTRIRYTTIHCIILHYTPLHSTTLNCTTTSLHYCTLHYTQLHYATLHLQLQPQLQLCYFSLHYSRLHYITPPYIALH